MKKDAASSRKTNNHDESQATAFLEGYLTCAFEQGVPLRSVCERLGQILSTAGPRSSKHLPLLRKESAGDTPRRKAVESVANASNAHRTASSHKGHPRLKRGERLSKNGRVISVKALRALRRTAKIARAALAAKRKAAA